MAALRFISTDLRPSLASKTCHQHPHGPLAHGIRLQGRERTRITIDLVRGQTVRRRASGEEEMALRVEAEGAGDRFSRHVPNGRQPPGGAVDGEARDAVVAAVRSVQELPRGRDLNLGAGVPVGVPCWQGSDRLKRRQRSRRSVETVAGDTAALLVGKVEDVVGGMKAKVARPQVCFRLDPER